MCTPTSLEVQLDSLTFRSDSDYIKVNENFVSLKRNYPSGLIVISMKIIENCVFIKMNFDASSKNFSEVCLTILVSNMIFTYTLCVVVYGLFKIVNLLPICVLFMLMRNHMSCVVFQLDVFYILQFSRPFVCGSGKLHNLVYVHVVYLLDF